MTGTKYIEKEGMSLKPSYYKKVYTGKLLEKEGLNDIFERFNIDRPEDFKGHSLSISDIIVVHKDNGDHTFYVEPEGFKRMSDDFTEELLLGA